MSVSPTKPAPPSSRSRGWTVAVAILLIAVGTVLRVYEIGRLEPFVDEAGNILTSIDPTTERVIAPLEQGRPLLSVMFRMANWCPESPVFAARLTTAFAGIAEIAALGAFLAVTVGAGPALTGMALWSVMPFAVFHERLALQDPFVTLLSTLALLCFALEARHRSQGRMKVWLSILGGAALGVAALCKLSAIASFAWIGIVYIGLQFHFRCRVFDLRILWAAVGCIAPFAALGSRLPHLGQALYQFGALPTVGMQRTGQGGGLAGLAVGTAQHIRAFLAWYNGYGQGILWGVVLIAVCAGLMRRRGIHVWLAGAWLLALLVSGVIYNLPYARYVHVDHVPLVLFVAAALGAFAAEVHRASASRLPAYLAIAAASATTLVWGRASWLIAADVKAAPIPENERYQYITGAWSGNGLRAVSERVRAIAASGSRPAVVITHAYWRVSCYGMLLSSRQTPPFSVEPYTIRTPDDYAAALSRVQASAMGPVLLLFEGGLYPVPDWMDRAFPPVKKVFDIVRDDGGSRFVMYQVDGAAGKAALGFPVQRTPYADKWIGPHYAFDLTVDAPATGIRILADTDPEVLRQSPVATLFVDDKQVASVHLDERMPMPFNLEFPVQLAPGVHRVRLIGSGWFVPSKLGTFADDRALFLRIGSIEAK